MKTFRVPIKTDIIDYTSVQDIWLSIDNQEKAIPFYKLERPNEIIVGIFEDNPGLEFSDSEPLDKAYHQLIASTDQSGDIFYFDTANGRLSASLSSSSMWVIFKRSEKKVLVINKAVDMEKLELDDCVIGFNRHLSEDELSAIFNEILGSDKITFVLLEEVREAIKKSGLDIDTVALFDYSPKESYDFTIKSTLNAVSLTIDMIKNKVLKYHYDKIWKIETVMHEALVNAITYGNELDYEKPVYINYEVGSKGLRIWVKDLGTGFDVSSFTVPVGAEALEQISGRGIFIMKKFSEALYFNEAGNQTILFFEF